MQSIGERLEEARKRKGISIREAAEATKIRGEFLLAFENNSMEIPLPEVYVRGFLINYIKFLKLDKEKLLADYNAMQLGRGTEIKKESHEYLGRMDLPEKEIVAESPEVPEPITSSTTSSATHAKPSRLSDRQLYYKVALVFGGTLLAIVVIVLLINLIFSSESPEINPDLRDEPVSTLATSKTMPPTADANVLTEEEITLLALDDVTIIVTQLIDNKRLYAGTLAKGETHHLTKMGPVRFQYTEGDNLVIEKGGSKFEMGHSGVGASTLD